MLTTEIVQGRKGETVLPSTIAVPRKGGDLLFGTAALVSNPDEYELIANWKLLIGKTNLQIEKESLGSPALEQVLQRYSLSDLLQAYLSYLAKEVFDGIDPKPQLIVGIPSTSNLDSKEARNRYRKLVSQALRKVGFPEPRFFPEPFATFQYHWNSDHIVDTGKPINIFLVDIGGGTTNVCMVRTSPHGRLARGGANHEPHGVVTIEIGGSQIDEMLCRAIGVDKTRVSGYELDRLRKIKEAACQELDRQKLWADYQRLKNTYEFKFDSGKTVSVNAVQIYETIEKTFWPKITSAIGESIRIISASEAIEKIEKVDHVILGGGTGQCGLIKHLFERAFRKNKLFLECSILPSSPEFGEAVAQGLVVEALANTNLYNLQAARTAPFLQQDIVLRVGHSRDTIAIPHDLRAEEETEEVDRKTGRILEAPKAITALQNKQMRWRFKLRQKPEHVAIELFKAEGDDENGIRSEAKLYSEMKRVCRRSGDSRPGAQCHLILTPQADGFAKVALETLGHDAEVVAHEYAPVDLHELCELTGSMFYALDLGTTSTLIAKGNAEQAAKPFSLPEQGYTAETAAIERMLALEVKARSVLSKIPHPHAFLDEVKEELISEYVYHSNRIEGSELSLRATQAVLTGVEDSSQLSAARIQKRIIDRVTFIDDRGNIGTSSRPIKDEVAATNLRDALQLTWQAAHDTERDISESFLKELHALVMRGDKGTVGTFRLENVRISQTSFVPPDHVQVPPQVQKMFEHFRGSHFKNQPAIFQAAVAHASFVSIHPFHDGNGRIARLLSNYFLWRRSLPGILLPFDNRERYYNALEELNTTEIITRRSERNITDLLQLFGDLFEDMMDFVQRKSTPTQITSQENEKHLDAPDSFAVESVSSNTRLGKLLDAITAKRKIALSIQDQYANWRSSFQGLLSTARNDFERASRALDSASLGTIDVREFPIIEFETYDNIRHGKHFNRTWYFELTFVLPTCVQRLIFFFGRNSQLARNITPELAFTCSLHISRQGSKAEGSIRAADDSWSPVLEFVHDGARLGMLVRDGQGKRIVWEDEPGFTDWSAQLLEAVLEKLADIKIA